MKKYISLLILICSMSISAQQPLDTIYANDRKNIALFFPNPIRQGITGASHFVFTYNREKEQYFGLLQAKPGTESNLLTVTSDGKVYSYILKYSKKLPKLNYFIAESESVGNELPKKTERKQIVNPKNNYANRITHFQKLSEYLLKSSFETMATERKKGIKLQLQKMVYDTSEVYLVMEITNRSGIDFDIDYLKVFILNGNKKRKASYQRLEQKSIYKYQMPASIAHGQAQRFVYVLPKSVLGDSEKLEVELREGNGSRKLVLTSCK